MPSDLKDLINAATEASNLTAAVFLGIQGDAKKKVPIALFDARFAAASHSHAWGTISSRPTNLVTLGSLADAAGVLTNDGAGVFSYTGKSLGGNAGSDGFSLALFDSDGSLSCTRDLHITSDGGVGIFTLAAPASVADNYGLTLPQANAYLAASPNADGSLSLFDLSNIPADAVGVLTSDGMGGLSWSAGGGGGGLTVGTTTITSGTSGRWLYNNGGVLGEIALGTGVATWLQTPTLANLNSAVSDADLAQLGANTFTGVQTISAGSLTTSALSVAQTWNSGATVCRGLEVAITDTASATGSTPFRIRGGAAGTTQLFSVDKNGWLNGIAGASMVIAPASGHNLALYPTGGGHVQIYTNLVLASNTVLSWDTGVGVKFASATNQKMGFWNASPIVQPTTSGSAATLVSNGGTALTSTDTLDGYTLPQVVKALRNMGLLA